METTLKKIDDLDRQAITEILHWRGGKQERLFREARNAREKHFDNAVELRSVIEVSNICRQQCLYCTMGKQAEVNPFTLTKEKILHTIDFLYESKGRRTILLQAGENPDQKFINHVSSVCFSIRERYPDVEVALCLGNLHDEQYEQLFVAGACRYILKFETSSPRLYSWYKNERDTLKNRLSRLQVLQEIGFQIGTGSIIGLPRQTLDDVVNDILLTQQFELSMVSATVFIPNERSAFAGQRQGDLELTLNAIALLRLLNPRCLMPATSSLERAEKGGQLRGLLAGCNTLTIHDGTPPERRADFPIYSDSRFRPQTEFCRNLAASANMTCRPVLHPRQYHGRKMTISHKSRNGATRNDGGAPGKET